MTAKELSEETVSKVMREMGRRGGKARVPKGVSTLTKRQRAKRAKDAARARWGKAKGKK